MQDLYGEDAKEVQNIQTKQLELKNQIEKAKEEKKPISMFVYFLKIKTNFKKKPENKKWN